MSVPLPATRPAQDQPLLLADLLEEERREQQRQQPAAGPGPGGPTAAQQMQPLSDADLEKLKADVLSAPPAAGAVAQPGQPMARGV